MKDFSKYLPGEHKPFSKALEDIYYLAHSELLYPFPSVDLKDFPKLDKMTGGLRPYEFTILCGATGTGKTTLAANLSLDLLKQGVPQFVASVETGATDYVKRMISAQAEHDWNSGEAVHIDKLRVFEAQHKAMFKGNPCWVSLYDDRTTVEALMADLAFMVKENKVKVAVIDNLNFFLEITSAANAVVEMDRVIHELIIFCKQVPIHLIMIMHPKKTETGRVESEFDIKGSSTAVQEAHNVLLFNRAHPDLIRAGTAIDGDREIQIAKMRRRGKYVRRRLLIKCKNSVRYFEGDLV
jgi:replicative DNA helicase